MAIIISSNSGEHMDRYASEKDLLDRIDELSEENANLRILVKRLYEDKCRLEKKHKISSFLGLVFIALGAVMFTALLYGEYKDYRSARRVRDLQEQKTSAYGGTYDMSESDILPEYRKMYKENSDLVGWIVIGGTDVNYPVVQSKVWQEYYLNHNFDGEKDDSGSLFADARNDVFTPDDNIIIYGHNMKNGSMFGTLKLYLDKNYYSGHKIISFDTLYERRAYKIAAVGLSKASGADSGGFKYYNFLNADDEKSFKKYADGIKKIEAYETGVPLEYGDKLITLSTCSSAWEDGRLFIVAKEVEDEVD